MTMPFPALEAVENLITELVNDQGWGYQEATDVVEHEVFEHRVKCDWGVQELIDAHGAQAVEEAVRRLRA